MPGVEWVEPALVWNGRKLNNLLQPRLVEFNTDNFLPEFIEAMSAVGKDADPASYLSERLIAGDSQPRLFQPLHGRYYLVTGSLVCRQLGLPDKVVDRASGESVSFVLRRTLTNGSNVTIEQAWINEGPNRGWHPVNAKSALPDEERFPMHPLKVCTQSKPSLDNFRPVAVCLQERTIYHGYLPTGNREKYLQPDPTFSTPQDYIAAIESQSSEEDFRYNEFDTRVVSAWADLLKRSTLMQNEDDRAYSLSLYLILDFGDYLSRTMPQVWNAVTATGGNINLIPASRTAQRALYTTLNGITIAKGTGTISLRAAMEERKDDLALVNGEGTEPNVQYDFRNVSLGALETAVRNALAEEPSDFQMSTEMVDILQNLVKPEPAATDTAPENYFIRLVYDYNPDCPPIVSAQSQTFTFARFFDSDAPARHIRLELPSINMQDLRKFKRGVGMQMSPALRRLMGRVNEDMIDGEGLGPEGPGWELGMICTFSLQIIFLVAFIVMFIFLILLNIVFWWLPFLKICFPIPRRSS